MLSRRSVRVKVMQVLYALNKDESLKEEKIEKVYWDYVDSTYDLFLYNMYVISQIAKKASDDLEKRKSKHLPTEEDKKFTDKFAQNALTRCLRDKEGIVKVFEKKYFEQYIDQDQALKIYTEFSKTPEYLAYLDGESEQEDHVEILLELYRFCRQNDLFKEMMTDRFFNWTDDKSMVIGTTKKVIKDLPVDIIDIKKYYPDDETVKEFGQELLDKTVKGNEFFLELIQPTLDNWDSERLATVDMILLKMAVCEMMYFDTIPTKVTLNEYVEIAKKYSTDKSREFINGVLDKLMKELEKNGKIKKSGRGLSGEK